jgi:hypothetical protein
MPQIIIGTSTQSALQTHRSCAWKPNTYPTADEHLNRKYPCEIGVWKCLGRIIGSERKSREEWRQLILAACK